MTIDKLQVNASLEELTVSTTKRVWVKPNVEIISVETGTTRIHFENQASPNSVPNYIS